MGIFNSETKLYATVVDNPAGPSSIIITNDGQYDGKKAYRQIKKQIDMEEQYQFDFYLADGCHPRSHFWDEFFKDLRKSYTIGDIKAHFLSFEPSFAAYLQH